MYSTTMSPNLTNLTGRGGAHRSAGQKEVEYNDHITELGNLAEPEACTVPPLSKPKEGWQQWSNCSCLSHNDDLYTEITNRTNLTVTK